jgi:hypothetical protein
MVGVMSRLVVPVSKRILWSTGDILRWVELTLLLKNNAGAWQRHRFRLDSASEMTTFPAYRAKQRDLPMPQQAVVGAVHTQTGLEIRSGFLRFQIVGMDQTEYVTPCLFLGDPNRPPAGQAAALPPKLLQPLGLLDQLRFTMDRDPSAGTLDGELLIEKK